MPFDSELQDRGRLVRLLGQWREMLPGSFVERRRKCGKANCRCAQGKDLHTQFQLSLLIDGKLKTINIPAALAEKARNRVEMRHRFQQTADSICSINLRRFLRSKEEPEPDRD